MRGTVSWPEEEASDAMCICDVHASFQTFRSVLLRFQPKQLHGRTMHALAGSLNRSAHQPYELGCDDHRDQDATDKGVSEWREGAKSLYLQPCYWPALLPSCEPASLACGACLHQSVTVLFHALPALRASCR